MNFHVALNAWFWNRPDTGSGQYLRGLVDGLRAVEPDIRLTLVAPEGWQVDAPPGVGIERVRLRGAEHVGKVLFEQKGFPQAASRVGADLAHIPYWGAPLSSSSPIVVTIHDLIPLLLPAYRGGLPARLYTALVAASARGASAVLTDSAHSGRDISKHLTLPADRVHAILLACGKSYRPESDKAVDEAVRRKYDLPPEYVLYLGGSDVRKNVDTLIEAFVHVKAGTGGDIPLVLAGHLPKQITPRFIDVRQVIDRMNMGDAVRAIGPADEADKPSLYRMAKCFVFPSRYEGFGLPVLEAMTCGTPVVAADTSSLPEIVGEAGFLVRPDDIEHLAGAILSILVEEDLAHDLSQKGIKRAACFSWERVARETAAVYQKVLDGKN
ncbi:MAG: glycosyltransferase family 4 protein [Anaerolineae bacterium]|nr:glycosyltransferase family 4 protein [Anaerolineae bacterium]